MPNSISSGARRWRSSRPRRIAHPTMAIAADQRLCLFGRTGSGKTTLAKRLLSSFRGRWLCLDPKWDFQLTTREGPVPIVEAYNPKLSQQILRVVPDEGELARYDEAIEQIWRDGESLLYIDEITLINPSRVALRPSLGKAVRTGRSRGLAVWSGSQRPKDIPSAVFTETEHFCVFQLQFKADREKVASFTGDNIASALKAIRRHDFVYYNVLDDSAFIARQGR